jgi:ribosomal protein S18 acetylase RimI-like enzyme
VPGDPATIVIRALRDGEEPRVIELWRACGLTRPWNDPARDLAIKRAHAAGELLVAELDGHIVGTAMCGFDGHRGGVYYLAVDPALQRRGIGARLMSAAEQLTLAAGAPKVNIMVRGDNREALAFYERLGYRVNDVLVLGKRLDGLDDAPAAWE